MSDTVIILSWDTVPGALKYRVCAQEIGVSSKTCVETQSTSGAKRIDRRITGLKPGVNYTFSIEAIFKSKYRFSFFGVGLPVV